MHKQKHIANCREGIIQPSRIGEDGRPVPVSHILELVEGQQSNPRQQEGNQEEDD